jgi:Flp pilus assembly protein TadG
MCCTRRQSPRRERGAVAVEFALVLPLLLLLVFGIVQYAYYFFQQQQGAFAVREAARQLAVGQISCSELGAFVGDRLSGTSAQVSVTAVDPVQTGDNVAVTVQFAATDFNFPLIPFPESPVVSEVAETRVENTTSSTDDYSTCSVTS